VVACSTLILSLTMFGVVPVASTILSKQNVERQAPFNISLASLLPVDSQPSNLTTAFSYVAYSNEFLDGSLPGFTRPEFAVLPFKADGNETVRPSERWQARSMLYEGRLNCTTAVLKFDFHSDYDGVSKYNTTKAFVADKPDCLINVTIPELDAVYQTIFQVVDDPNWIHTSCASSTNMLFGVWGRSLLSRLVQCNCSSMGCQSCGTQFSKYAAVFCQPVHEQQEVDVTVDASTGEILEIRRYPETKTEITSLNIKHWENLVFNAQNSPSTAAFNVSPTYGIDREDTMPQVGWRFPQPMSRLKVNPAFLTLMENYTEAEFGDHRLPINTNFAQLQSLGTYALAGQNNLEELFDPRVLAGKFDDAYRKMFAMAFSLNSGISFFADQPLPLNSSVSLSVDQPLPTKGKKLFKEVGYVVDTKWTRVLQATLSLVLGFILTLMVLTWNRQCGIGSDPGTIASAMIWVEPSVLGEFQGAEFIQSKALETALKEKSHRYKLQGQKVVVCAQGRNQASKGLNTEGTHAVLSKPWELTLAAGVFSLFLLLALIVVLSVYFFRNQSQQGFPTPTNRQTYAFYASYSPTIAATLYESYLVLLGSFVSLLFPFRKLAQRNASAANSLAINYDRAPPHLLFFDAFKTRNFLLALLSVSILLANVLAVALGGLFHQSEIDINISSKAILMGSLDDLEQYNATVFSKYDIDADHIYATTGERFGFKQRPWTTDDLFYIPFADTSQEKLARLNYTARTFAYGVNITCQEMSPESIKEWRSVIWLDKTPPVPWGSWESVGSKKYNDRINHKQSITFTYITSSDRNNTLLSYPLNESLNSKYIDQYSDKKMGGDDPDDEEKAFFSGSPPVEYIEWAPQQYKYPSNSNTVEFFASWTKSGVGNRSLTINRAGLWTNLYGKTINGLSVIPLSRVLIHCSVNPRVISSNVQVRSDQGGEVVMATDIQNVPLDHINSTQSGLSGILKAFQYMVNAEANPVGGGDIRFLEETYNKNRADPRPGNWFTFLVHEHARETNKDFDLYSYPQQSTQSIEFVYKKMFAIYIQIHSKKIFQQLERNKATGTIVPSSYIRREMRVLMRPVAFYVSIFLLAISIPAVAWTYASLWKAFLAHSPTTLSGMYASFYASRKVLDDVESTELLGLKTRNRAFQELGNKYGYGWFKSAGGEWHLGIEREPTTF